MALAMMLGLGIAAAQENRSVDGEDLGASDWQVIAPGESEFHRSSNTNFFDMQRNELPDRVQESWRHPDNRRHGPLITMFYERLHGNFFAAEMFEADFRSVFDLAFASRGVNLDDARVVALDPKAKAAFISYASTTCVFVMRMFGPITESHAPSNGDRSARLFVCQRGDTDENFLGDLAISMLSALKQDSHEIGVPGRTAPPLQQLLDRLFTREEAA
ncbi:MAG: hypothetical protein ABJ215_13760 [Alphaproteobacteria bacterium]